MSKYLKEEGGGGREGEEGREEGKGEREGRRKGGKEGGGNVSSNCLHTTCSSIFNQDEDSKSALGTHGLKTG